MSRTVSVGVALVVVGVALGGVGLVVGLSDGGAAAQPDATATVDTGEDGLELAAAANQTVTGETTVEPGSTVELRVLSTGESPFLYTPDATVREDGTFAATVDLSNVEPGSEFNVTVLRNGTVLGNATGTVAECETCEQTAGSDTRITTEGDLLRLSAGPGQTVRGVSDLDPGTVLTVRVRSATPRAPFLQSAEATVTDDGTFEATLDLGEAAVNTTFDAVVLRDGRALDETVGVVEDCSGDCPTTETPDAGGEDWESGAGAVNTSRVEVSDIAEGVAGGTAPINVAVGDREAVGVSVGGNGVNYVLNATVRDGNGDGLVRLQFDTAAAGHDEPTVTAAAAADSVTTTHETDLPAELGALDPATYRLRVFDGETTAAPLVDNGNLILHSGDSSPDTDSESADDGGSAEASTTAEFGLDSPVVRARSGRQATLAVGVGDAETATVAVGGPEQDLQLTVRLTDGNGDGTVAVLLDTSAVGDEDRASVLASDSADEVTVTDEAIASGDLPTGPYDIDIYRGDSVTDEPDDVGTLVLTEPATTGTASTRETGSQTGDTGTRDQSALLGGGALLAGGLLAVVGLGFVLGVFRN